MMQGKCFGIVLGCCLLAGCVIQRIDRTGSTLERFKGITNCSFETVSPLFMVVDEKTDERRLVYTDYQHYLEKIEDFKGTPIPVIGHRTRFIKQIAPTGTIFRIVRIIEHKGPETSYDRLYAKIIGGENDGEEVFVNWLFSSSYNPQKRIEPKAKFIRRVESGDL